MLNQVINVRYIGNKSIKTDTVCHTGVAWLGKDDVRPVSADVAAKLLAFPDVWVAADDDGQQLSQMVAGKHNAQLMSQVSVNGADQSVATTPADNEVKNAGSAEGDSAAEPPAEPTVPNEETNPLNEEPNKSGLGDEDSMTLADALGLLEPGSDEHFTTQNKPRKAAVESILGRAVEMAELQEAWAEFKGAE